MDKQEQIEENNAVIDNSLLDTIKASTDSLHDQLVNKQTRGKLPLVYLLKYFIPRLFGPEDPEKEAVVAEWISIAGSPTSEIEILDPQGTVLFIAPGLFDTSNIDVVNKNIGEGFLSIFSKYDLKSNNLQIIANKYLNEALKSKSNEIVPISNDNKSVKTWESILTTYKFISPTTPIANAGTDTTDDLDYDL